jgi:hypothetical protein
MGGQDFILAPLNFRQLRVTLKQEIENLRSEDIDVRLGAFEKVIHGSLSRNYPDITLEQVQEMLDMSNIFEVTTAVMRTSGLTKSNADEGGASGTDPLNGNLSTGT